MRLLVLGGTQFVGRAVAEAALAAGDDVTLFHRGKTNPGLFPEAEHVLGDRDGGLGALDGRDWDACIDVSGYVPRLVGDAARALHGRVPRYVYVSTVSVYADLSVPRDEDGPLATLEDETTEEIGGDTYGGLKALGEQAARRGVRGPGDRRASRVRDRPLRPHRPVPLVGTSCGTRRRDDRAGLARPRLPGDRHA